MFVGAKQSLQHTKFSAFLADPVTARELDQMYRDCSTRVDGFGQEIMGMQDLNSMAMDGMNMKGYWDPKGGGGDESGDGTALASSPGAAGGPPQGAGGPNAGSLQAPPMGNGNTGSLPDLTSLHFPPPLATPLDPSEELAHQQQGASPGPPSLPPLHPAWCWDPAVVCMAPVGSNLPRWGHPLGKYVHTPPCTVDTTDPTHPGSPLR
ncbi:hypothetical protein HPB52_019022 [Rhipicephalus sanguineus]|uniref:Transducer of regulated CREB activity middle domain-containing protein n=1 Tax=Rhipicephalus sanguineus TaxID=34632 RepID=A0A9D4Q4M8_RHISA|nr:hypothetical protein HPB52_019022 [Rhipicephalus sanguineus]